MTDMTWKESESNYVCPVCGRHMMSADELCDGSFLDPDHPTNVKAVVGQSPLRASREP